MTNVLSGPEFDQAAIDAAIARSPFNAHEKSHVAVGRSVMALMYKDGYRAALTHADYRALEEELAVLRGKVGDLESSLWAIASSTSHAYRGIHDPIVGLRATAREALERFRA